MVNRPFNFQIDWNAVFSSMMAMTFVIAMARVCIRMLETPEERLARFPQTLRTLRFATTPRESDRDTFAEWVETGNIQLLQAGGYYRDGRKPTLAVLDDTIYAVVRYGDEIKLLSVRWEDLAEETLREVEEHGVKIAGVAMLPQVKRKEVAPYKAIVECPLCGDIIEVREYDTITRTEALKRHIEEKHSVKHGKTTPERLPQALLIEGGEPVPLQYRDLVGLISEPLPEYSLAVELLPAVEAVAGERKIDAVMRQLKDGVENIQDSYQFRLFLTTMSEFHNYSIGNQILIMLQKPGATRVAGFVAWKDLGRWVKRGEKGISILAPRFPPRPTCPKCGAKVPKGAGFCPKCGASVEEGEIEVAPAYFIVVYVFDISQTEGKPLPEFEVPVLTGEVNEELFARLLDLMKSRGIKVSFESRPHLPPEIKGHYRAPDEIWVRPEEPRAQQLKTLLHEVAHYYSEGVFRISRRDAETIAESAAYVVGAHYGFDTGVRSFPYVALWAQDKKVLEQNLGAIRRVAATIMEETPGSQLMPRVVLMPASTDFFIGQAGRGGLEHGI